MRRRVLLAALYFSEGAPIGFVWWALPTKLRSAGVDVRDITALTALLALPWALKFAWAPAVDALRSARFGFAHWVAVAQIGMGACLLPMLTLDLRADFSTVYALLFAHAVFAATQDVAIDGLCIAAVPAGERGRANAWMQGGMLLGRGLFGGGVLLVSAHVGFAVIIGGLIGCIWATLALLALWRRVLGPAQPSQGWTSVWRALATALSSRTTWVALAFAATAGAAYEGAAGVAGPFMIDLGLSETTVGIFFTAPSLLAMATGAGIGGWLGDRRGAARATGISQVAMTAVVASLAALEFAGVATPAVALIGFTALYLTIGAFTAASYALLMDVADGAARATAFSAFMAMTNVCEMWSARVVGVTHARGGYALGFALLAGASALALMLLRGLRVQPRADTSRAAERPSDDGESSFS